MSDIRQVKVSLFEYWEDSLRFLVPTLALAGFIAAGVVLRQRIRSPEGAALRTILIFAAVVVLVPVVSEVWSGLIRTHDSNGELRLHIKITDVEVEELSPGVELPTPKLGPGSGGLSVPGSRSVPHSAYLGFSGDVLQLKWAMRDDFVLDLPNVDTVIVKASESRRICSVELLDTAGISRSYRCFGRLAKGQAL